MYRRFEIYQPETIQWDGFILLTIDQGHRTMVKGQTINQSDPSPSTPLPLIGGLVKSLGENHFYHLSSISWMLGVESREIGTDSPSLIFP